MEEHNIMDNCLQRFHRINWISVSSDTVLPENRCQRHKTITLAGSEAYITELIFLRRTRMNKGLTFLSITTLLSKEYYGIPFR